MLSPAQHNLPEMLAGPESRGSFLCGWEQPPRDLAGKHLTSCVPAGA